MGFMLSALNMCAVRVCFLEEQISGKIINKYAHITIQYLRTKQQQQQKIVMGPIRTSTTHKTCTHTGRLMT